MAYIILPHRWRRQPTSPVGINWSHPLARGLVLFAYGPLFRDITYSNAPSITGTSVVPTDGRTNGLGRNFPGSNEYLDWGDVDRYDITGALSFVTRVLPNLSGATFFGHLTKGTGAAPIDGYFTYVSASDVRTEVGRANSGGTGRIHNRTETSDQWSAGWHTFGYIGRDAIEAVPDFFRDRTKNFGTPSDIGTGTGSAGANAKGLRFGRRDDGATQYKGGVEYVAVWNRQLSDGEYLAYEEAPYQIVRPLQRRIYVPSAGGGITAGSFVAAAGAATAATMAGASTSAASFSVAAGVATAGTLAGASTAATAFSAASGVATAATLAGASVAAASFSVAAGVATAGTLAGASTAAADFVAAAGVATAATMVGDALAAGTTSFVPATGVATAATMQGASTAAADFTPASGLATTGLLQGAGLITVATDFVVAAGVATTATMVGAEAGAFPVFQFYGADDVPRKEKKKKKKKEEKPEVVQDLVELETATFGREHLEELKSLLAVKQKDKLRRRRQQEEILLLMD